MAAQQSTNTVSDTGNIDLMGWDTVFALSLDALNNSIVTQKTTPPTFEGTDPQGGATVSGTWEAWSVEGGEGNGILMKCPVATGTLKVEGSDPIRLDGGYVEVMITLAMGDGAAQLEDKTAKDGTGQTKVFRANGNASDPFQQPKVQGVNFPSVKGIMVYAAEAAFGAYFNAHLSAFDAVFSAVRLEEEAVEADKQWLKPQASLYAMASAGTTEAMAARTPAGDQTQQDAYFGILSLTSKPQSGQKLPQQNFDKRMFDFFTKTATPTNSVFAVSAPLAMQNIILQSARHCVKNATVDDFSITNHGITVANKNTLNWGDFQFSKDSGQTVCPVISPGNFQLSLDGGSFHLSISQAAFTTPDGTCDVKITADQYFNFGATQLKDGKYYFTPDPGLGTNSIRADVATNKDFQIAMIIDSILISVAFGFLGAELGEALGDAFSSTTTSATEGAVEASEEALQNGLNDLGEDGLRQATNDAVSDATDAIASGGENTGGRSGLFANKFKLWGGVIGGLFGVPVGLLPQIMTAIYNDEIHQGNVPTLDDFATHFTGAVQWPQVKTWQVTGGTFASAFMLAGKASS